MFATTMLNVQLAIALGTVLTGGPVTPMSCLHAVPVLMLGARFSNRGLLVGVPVAVALVLATTLGVDLQYVLDNPESAGHPAHARALHRLLHEPARGLRPPRTARTARSTS